METSSIVIESKALPWFGILGNSKGHGRPDREQSAAPITCPPGNKAIPCLPERLRNAPKGLPVTQLSKLTTGNGGISSRNMSAAVFAALLLSGLVASLLTRAVLLHGLEISLNVHALLQAPTVVVATLRELVVGKPRTGMAPAAGAGSGYSTV